MGRVWLDLVRGDPPPWRRQPGVAPRPHPVGTAKVGDAGVGADARPRESDEVLALDDPPSDLPFLLVDGLFTGHAVCPKLVCPLSHSAQRLVELLPRSSGLYREILAFGPLPPLCDVVVPSPLLFVHALPAQPR